jgi:hypothetical protein
MDKSSNPGKSVRRTKYFGFFSKPVDANSIPDAETRKKLQKDAAENLSCINSEERQRRRVAGYIGLILTAGAFVSMTYMKVSPYICGAVCYIPVVASYGFILQARDGLCNIAQLGLWDVDGSGMQKIEDRSLAEKILKRVKQSNKTILMQSAMITLISVLLSKYTMQALLVSPNSSVN